MKKLSILCLAVSLLLTASCSKEELSNETGGLYTLTGVVEENTPITRVGFDLENNGSFFWNSGDAIAVGASSLAKYTTACNDKSTSATFTGYSPASGYAVYPWERAQSISGNELTYEFESEYNYTTVDADFFSGMSVDMPMWAKVEGSTLAFKHLGGIFAFKFPNLKAGDNQVFTLTANSKISGVFTANLSDSEPIFETSTEGVQDADKKVTINFSLVSDADAVFYVPVPVGTYSLKVEIQNGEDTYSQEYKNLAVARRSIRYTTLSSHSLQGSEAKEVESASDVTSAMEYYTNVVLNEIESQSANSTVSIELPKKSENSEVAHSLSIGSIDGNTETIEIKESDSDNEGNSISELVISVPTTEDAKKLVIDMPNTTVSILVNGMNNLTLDEVIASTAESTLIVSKGVTINTLKVRQGNVSIEEGGKVENITIAEENTAEVTYVTYAGAEAKKVAYVATFYGLKTALADNATTEINLLMDIETSEQIEVLYNIIINGNNKKLIYTGDKRAINVASSTNGANLTINDLTVEFNSSYSERGIQYATSGKLELNNVTVESEVVTYVVNFPSVSSGATVTITNSKLKGLIALNIWGENMTFNVTNTELTSVDKNSVENYAAVSLSYDGINGANGTTVNIEGGSITATDENEQPSTAVINSTATGVVNISSTTQVTGAVKNPVALVLYEGANEFYSCFTLKDAIETVLAEKVTGKASVKVIKDIMDLDADETITIPSGKTLVIDLNNHTVAGISDQTGANRNMFDVRGTLIIKNGSVTIKHEGENMAWNNSTNVFNVTDGGVLTIENATVENLGGSDMGFCVHLNNWGEVTLNATNVTFKSNYVGIRAFNSGNDKNNITLAGCNILTGNSCIWVHNYTAADFGNDETKAAAAAERLNFNFTNTTIARTNASKSLVRFGFTDAIYYSDIEMTEVVAGSEAALAWAFAHGKNVILNNNITLNSSITVPVEAVITFDLNGKTISQTSDTPVSMITNNGNLTIKDSSNGSGKIDFTFNGTVNNGVAANAISNRGTLLVEGGEISNTGTDNQIGYAIDNYNGSTLTVNGGKITASGSSYYDGIRLFCGSSETTVTVNNGDISTIWAQNPSENKAAEVKGTVIINGGIVGTTYYENYTTVKVKSGITTTVTPYGEGSNNTTTTTEGEYTVYSFTH